MFCCATLHVVVPLQAQHYPHASRKAAISCRSTSHEPGSEAEASKHGHTTSNALPEPHTADAWEPSAALGTLSLAPMLPSEGLGLPVAEQRGLLVALETPLLAPTSPLLSLAPVLPSEDLSLPVAEQQGLPVALETPLLTPTLQLLSGLEGKNCAVADAGCFKCKRGKICPVGPPPDKKAQLRATHCDGNPPLPQTEQSKKTTLRHARRSRAAARKRELSPPAACDPQTYMLAPHVVAHHPNAKVIILNLDAEDGIALCATGWGSLRMPQKRARKVKWAPYGQPNATGNKQTWTLATALAARCQLIEWDRCCVGV
jgi:hypothetical protein